MYTFLKTLHPGGIRTRDQCTPCCSDRRRHWPTSGIRFGSVSGSHDLAQQSGTLEPGLAEAFAGRGPWDVPGRVPAVGAWGPDVRERLRVRPRVVRLRRGQGRHRDGRFALTRVVGVARLETKNKWKWSSGSWFVFCLRTTVAKFIQICEYTTFIGIGLHSNMRSASVGDFFMPQFQHSMWFNSCYTYWQLVKFWCRNCVTHVHTYIWCHSV
jgi:hypothetical protein